MNLTKTALKRPVSCMIIIIALIVFGISSITGFKLQLIPDMEMPMLIVMTVYPGADPESVDELVTSVVEDAGSSLSGVDMVMSYSYENYSLVLFEYDYGEDIDDCYTDLRAALDTASLSLPDDVNSPTVIEMNMNSMASMAISATEVGDIDLLKVINDSVVPELEKISGVAEVAVSGGTDEYIKVELNENLLNQYGLTMSSISQVMGSADFTYPAGSVTQGTQDISVSTAQSYDTVQKIKNMPLTTSTGAVITLQDVATITSSAKESSTVSRYDSQDNVSISIQNKSSYGTVNVCNSVKKAMETIKAENPAIDFQITYDASDSIISSLTSVAETLILGVVLSMVVLFLFFGDIKASLIVGSSMPISLLVTLILMNAAGFSLNVVTMGSLVIAIGMMVDSSIVVIESCFRLKQKHGDFKDAALEGTRIVTASIIASTITTIVVYLPLATMEGLSGQMFSQLGLTIVFAMVASLITAMTLVPLFYFKFKPLEKKEIPMNRFLDKVVSGYKKILRKVLRKKKFVVLVSAAMVVVSVLMATQLNVELMPSSDEGIVSVSVAFRPGTTLEVQNAEMQKWERIAAEDEDVESYSLSIGSGTSVMSSSSSGDATLTANLKKDRSMSTAEKVDQWNELAATMTGIDVTVASSGSSMSSMMSTGNYEVDLQGNDMGNLKVEAEKIAENLKAIDGVVKVDTSTQSASTIAKIEVDPLKAMQYGLTPISVGVTLNNVLSGTTAMTITNSGTEYDVNLEYPEGVYDDLNSLMNLNIATARGTTIPLRDIAEIVYEDEQETLTKTDGLYQVSVTATLNSAKQYDAQNAIKAYVEDYAFPEGIAPADSAINAMMIEELSAIFRAILIAVFLVFMVMAMQFESARFSLMVMMCIPFSLIGSFFLLFLTKSTLSMTSMMGFLMLMGIVVNNGILYVDSTNQLKETMSIEDALVETGAIRLRPILMTSLTTILSMIPLAVGIGDNAAMMQGMAVVIIGGMVASTILTLILLPTFYLILIKKDDSYKNGIKEARIARREKRLAKKQSKQQ